MKRFVRVAMAGVVVFLTGTMAMAQGMGGSGGWGMRGSYQRMYNQATVESVSGQVVSVDTMMPMKGMGSGIHLTLKTDKETIPVHLGPSWFIERLDSKIEKGDRIEVKGSRVTMMGNATIIAAEVKKGTNLLLLRDKNGVPVWSGWRR
ncbi:hypothetical protein [Pelobacter propionicus]|nr:hypothetical protein [Pelobacter propionicus]